MGPNTTGLPKTDDYLIGRGILYASALDANGVPTNVWRDLGNAPALKVSVTTEELKHKSSRSGLKTIDLDILVSQEAEVSFTLDEINNENLALFFSGLKVTHTNVAIGGFAIFDWVTNANLFANTWYDIVNAAGERAYDVLTADFVLKTGAADAVTLVAGTDYVLDGPMGRILIKNTAAIITAIAAGAANGKLRPTLTARAGAKVVSEVQTLTQTTPAIALKFIGENAATGEKTEFQARSVKLIPDGDFNLISDDVTTMGFKGSLGKSIGADSESPTFTIRTMD